VADLLGRERQLATDDDDEHLALDEDLIGRLNNHP
jgi:hypothetical protein